MKPQIQEQSLDFFKKLPQLGNVPFSAQNSDHLKNLLPPNATEAKLFARLRARILDLGFPGPKAEFFSQLPPTLKPDLTLWLKTPQISSSLLEESKQTLLKQVKSLLPQSVLVYTSDQFYEIEPLAEQKIIEQIQAESNVLHLCQKLQSLFSIHIIIPPDTSLPNCAINWHSLCSFPFHVYMWLGKNSQTNWSLEYHSQVDTSRLCGMSLWAEPHAQVNLEVSHLSSTGVDWNHFSFVLKEGSAVTLTGYSEGSQFSHQSLSATLAEPEARLEVKWANLLTGSHKSFLGVHVHHQVPHTHSYQEFRSIAAGQSKLGLDLALGVYPQAAQISARQTIHNLLIGEQVQAQVKPQLMIFSDDVQCSHGATTGQLDADQLFYLESRGLSPAEATALLTESFLAPLFENSSASWKTHLQNRIHKQLEII